MGEGATSGDLTNPDDIEFAFEGTTSGSGEFGSENMAPASADANDGLGGLDLDDVDFTAMLEDDENNDRAEMKMSTGSSQTARSFGDMADGWSGTVGTMARLDKRALTLADLNLEIDAVDVASTLGSTTGTFTGTESFGGDDSTDEYDGVIVTRHLGNYRFVAYSITAVSSRCAHAPHSWLPVNGDAWS